MDKIVEHLQTIPTSNGMISFAHEGPFLVAGPTPGTGCTSLRILRTTRGLNDRTWFPEPAAEFAAPTAAFCCVCWSRPLGTGGSSCPAGLIVGGLESGEVAVWDPREALRDTTCLHPDEEPFLASIRSANLCNDYVIVDGPDKRRESRVSPPLLDETTGNLAAAQTTVPMDLQAPVARFAKLMGSVRGLAFSSYWPNLIGSGAENGRIMIWDLSKPYSETVPTWQAETADGDAISCISWSPLLPRVLGSTSFQGVHIWDTRSKSPKSSLTLFPRKMSALAFSPVDQFSVVVSCEDYLDTPSLSVRDLRNMSKPVSELCENVKGVIAMSWSPHHDDNLLVSTKNDKIMLWSIAKEKAIWKSSSTSGRFYDVQWSPSNRGFFAAASHNHLDLFKLNERALPTV